MQSAPSGPRQRGSRRLIARVSSRARSPLIRGGPVESSHDAVRALARTRWRIAILLTAIMIAVYFGFIALIAFDKPLLATRIAPGLTLGILLGVCVIVVSWLRSEERRVGKGWRAR